MTALTSNRVRASLFAMALASAFAACSSRDPAANTPKVGTNWGFSLDVPNSLAVEEVTRAMDFDVYAIKQDGEPILNWYLGQHPNFSDDDAKPALIGAARGRCISIRPKMSCLFELKATPFAPFMHMWHGDLTPAQSAQVDAILATMKLE